MKIYTRGGDDGTTGLLGGARVSKDDPRIAAYGSLDELNAFLGVARAADLPAEIDAVIAGIQNDLFTLGAELASPASAPRGVTLIDGADIARIEQSIDRFEERLPPLRDFVLPYGVPPAAALHAARAVCRRAERELVALSHAAPIRSEVIQYVNRAGDLLFVLARASNAAGGIRDTPWQKKP